MTKGHQENKEKTWKKTKKTNKAAKHEMKLIKDYKKQVEMGTAKPGRLFAANPMSATPQNKGVSTAKPITVCDLPGVAQNSPSSKTANKTAKKAS